MKVHGAVELQGVGTREARDELHIEAMGLSQKEAKLGAVTLQILSLRVGVLADHTRQLADARAVLLDDLQS